jgi:hypothetical protein
MLGKLTYASVAALTIGLVAAAPAFAEHRHYHVQYRVPEWRERTFSSREAAHDFVAYKRSQGFDAFVDHHRGHFDVRFRLPTWQTFRTVESHRAAHDLERLLERRGYDARVLHH